MKEKVTPAMIPRAPISHPLLPPANLLVRVRLTPLLAPARGDKLLWDARIELEGAAKAGGATKSREAAVSAATFEYFMMSSSDAPLCPSLVVATQ
jgi:hypothetical protein